MKKHLLNFSLFFFTLLSTDAIAKKIVIDPLYASTTIVVGIKNGKEKIKASGFFFVDEKDKLYLVTNKHVIYGEKFAEEVDPIIDKIKLNLHVDPNNLKKNKELTINLIEGRKKKWLELRSNPEVDVVLIIADIDRTKYFLIPLNKSFIETGTMQVSFEKIFIMGYPFGWYDKVNNLPITRVGHLSSPFKVPFMGKQVMLGDVETHNGMSGSPVFMRLEDYTEKKGDKSTMHIGSTKIVLLGIHSGQPLWQLEDKKSGKKKAINHTLRNIWFADIILDIIKDEKISTTITVERRKEVAKLISDYCGLRFEVDIRGPLTVAQIEKETIEELKKAGRKDVPLVPYGFINDRWNQFKSKYEEGDELYFFTSDQTSWSGLYGREGHVIIRKNRVIDMIISKLS